MARISLGSATTDSNGKSTFNIPKGMGKQSILAVLDDNQSKGTGEIIQGLYYDPTTSDRTSDYYYNPNYGTLSYSDGYYILSMNGTANYVNLRNSIANPIVKGTTFNFKVDLVLNGASVRLRVYDGSTPVKTSEYTTTDGTLLLEDITIPSNSTNSILLRIERRYNNDGDSIKFKNFTIYPSESATFTFADKGVSDNYNDDGWTAMNGITVTRGDNYTTLNNSISSSRNYYRDISFNSIIEFDKIGTSSNDYFIFGDRDGNSFSNDIATNMATDTQNNCHIKIIFTETTITVYADGTIVRDSVSHSITSNPSFRLQINNGGYDIKYKNFKVYDYNGDD